MSKLLTREERRAILSGYEPNTQAGVEFKALCDHADEQDAIIEQLRQAVGRLSLKARAALAAGR